MNNHSQYRPRVMQVKQDEQVRETISTSPSLQGTLQYNMVWNLLGFLFVTPWRASAHLSLITEFLHDLGLSFCFITFGRTVHVMCYWIQPGTCLLWFPRPAVAHLLWPQTSSGMRKDRREVWTNQTNGGCTAVLLRNLSSLPQWSEKPFFSIKMENHAFCVDASWKVPWVD